LLFFDGVAVSQCHAVATLLSRDAVTQSNLRVRSVARKLVM